MRLLIGRHLSVVVLLPSIALLIRRPLAACNALNAVVAGGNAIDLTDIVTASSDLAHKSQRERGRPCRTMLIVRHADLCRRLICQ